LRLCAFIRYISLKSQSSKSANILQMLIIGGSESLAVTFWPDEVSKALTIGINALPGLCVIVL
ncbi:TPA: hypothetical protein ACG343_005196, partial [Escherichia coli]